MAAHRAPKQWLLTKNETITSYESWRQNLLYTLSLDESFSPFLADGVTWQKKTASNPSRGFRDDGVGVAADKRRSATQKNSHLELMLGQIANFCPIISRNSIVKTSTSLSDIWQKIRQHFGFQSTGAHFLDLHDIKLEPDERPEDLFQRLTAFFEDSLLYTGCGVTHHGEAVTIDEDMTPTIENTIVYLWLSLIDSGLPQLVKQKYGADLRNRSLASLKPEISQALSSLQEELRLINDTRAMRIESSYSFRRGINRRMTPKKTISKSCILCKAMGRSHNTHSLADCRFVPNSDKGAFGRSRLVIGESGDDLEEDVDDNVTEKVYADNDFEHSACRTNCVSSNRRVKVVQSPVLTVFYQQHPVSLTIDTGATTNMIRASTAKAYRLPVQPASQIARQADGVTPLEVTGEVHCTVTRGDLSFQLNALVVSKLDVDVLAGNPFLVNNDIAVRPAKRQIIINGDHIIPYGTQNDMYSMPSARRTQAFLLRNQRKTVILPGDYLELSAPDMIDGVWAIEPRLDSRTNSTQKAERAWPPPQEVTSVGGTVRMANDTDDPILVSSGEHICQARLIADVPEIIPQAATIQLPTMTNAVTSSTPFSVGVTVDPDSCLPTGMRDRFRQVNMEYDDVFNPAISKYNGASGKIEAFVNMGPSLPPQRKGRLPQYNRSALDELQSKFDELEAAGVVAKPEQVNVRVEYLNPSFLVRKPSGGSRLVTSFGEVAQYSKPQPSLMPNVDSVLRQISKWRYIIITDLVKAFYQIPLAHDSMKFCGVVTPFKGVRVYTRSAMGMPGSETCLEELMSRILGDMLQEGCVAKIADDLFVGGDTPDEALVNWGRVLALLKRNNLRLSAPKTIICPRSAGILGWIWRNGSLSVSPHKVATLCAVEPPATVRGLRSFVGAYKVLSRVLRGYADLLDPLDCATAGRASNEKIDWSDDLLHAFKSAQNALSECKAIVIPRPDDTLWIVTDGSIKNRGIAATLYVRRGEQLLLAGFFNAKLRKHQVTWLPCELEALCIGAAIRHFAPYVIQSHHDAQVLTDSRPCVQAYDKLMRGEFSASSRVTSFLSTVSRYHAHIRHIVGIANLPSDFGSRNPCECTNASCQVCQFIAEMEDSVVRGISVSEVLDGSARMPFTSRTAWHATQLECPDLRRTHSHLTQGTRPSKKMTKIGDVKRYLRVVSVANDGVLIIKEAQPFQPSRERIVVPRSIVDGLLTALHIRFSHPSKHQIKRLFNRHFFALDVDRAAEATSASCHQCQSLKSIPTHLHPQASTQPPTIIGSSFAADVMRRYRQYIFLLRETVSSFTWTALIDGESHDKLRGAILSLCAEMRLLGDHPLTIRVDAAPGFTALVNDSMLATNGIQLDVGQVKNINKNPVAERAIQELGLECLHLSPEGGPISTITLALATANMNSRIRRDGISAREAWTQRDQVTGEQLPLSDRALISSQNVSRNANHAHSAASKAHGNCSSTGGSISVGDLVFLKGERNKCKARDKYMVVQVLHDDGWCKLRKFTLSQFRSKTYDIRICDCYPVASTTLAQSPQGPIRGQQEDESDSESVLSEPPDSTTRDPPSTVRPDVQALPPPPEAIVMPHQDDTGTVTVDVPMPATPRRSSRTHRRPYWQDNQWIMETSQ